MARLAAARSAGALSVGKIGHVLVGGKTGTDQFGGQPEREGAGLDQRRAGRGPVMGEIAGRQLVGEQEVGGGVVGKPRQRLGERHHRQPFWRRQLEFVQEFLDAAEAGAARSHRADQALGQGPGGGVGRFAQKFRRERLVGRRIGRPKNIIRRKDLLVHFGLHGKDFRELESYPRLNHDLEGERG